MSKQHKQTESHTNQEDSTTKTKTGKPAETARQDDKEFRIRTIIKMMEEGHGTSLIKGHLARSFFMPPRTAEKYLRLARERIALNTAATIPELRDEAYLRLMKIYREAKTDQNKLAAIKQMIELLGLKAQEIDSEPPGKPNARREVIERMMSDPQLIEFYRQQAAGNDAQECDLENQPVEPDESASGDGTGTD